MSKVSSKVLGSGATAVVFPYEDDKVIKIFNKDQLECTVEEEYRKNQLIQNIGLMVPKVYKHTRVEDRQAIIMEYIKGDTLFNQIFKSETSIEQLAQQFAKLHYEVHCKKGVALESGKKLLRKQIGWSNELSSKQLKRLDELLEELDEQETLCHNDFHPNNIIIKEGIFYIIDWNDASRGNALMDVARTSLIFEGLDLSDQIPNQYHQRINTRRKEFGQLYLEAYSQLTKVNLEELEKWKVIVAASRLFCEPPINKPMLHQVIKKYCNV